MAGFTILLAVALYLHWAWAFVHPGLLVIDTDVARIQGKLKSNEAPWTTSWATLETIRFSDPSYTASPAAVVVRAQSTGEQLWHDTAAAFDLALRWKISGDDQYASAAASILTAWANTLTGFGTDDDEFLSAGLQGYELVNAAELLRDYEPFKQTGFDAVAEMFTSIFLPMNVEFLNHERGSEHNVKHFFANWELAQIASVMAIGVFTDNQTAWDYAINYFKNGTGNGNIYNAITNIVEEPGTGTPLGQGQESGRDQGHSALDFELLGVIGQQSYHQGEDLFAFANNRILLGAEYFARYNLGEDVPFEPYTNGIVSYTTISNASRGAVRPAWELLYNHYAIVKGLDAPWTAKYLNNTLTYFKGAEGGIGSWGEGSGHYDGLGWGTLLYRLDTSDVSNSSTTTTTSVPAAATTSAAPVSTLSSSAGIALPSTKATTYSTKVSQLTTPTTLAAMLSSSVSANANVVVSNTGSPTSSASSTSAPTPTTSASLITTISTSPATLSALPTSAPALATTSASLITTIASSPVTSSSASTVRHPGGWPYPPGQWADVSFLQPSRFITVACPYRAVTSAVTG